MKIHRQQKRLFCHKVQRCVKIDEHVPIIEGLGAEPRPGEPKRFCLEDCTFACVHQTKTELKGLTGSPLDESRRCPED